MMSPKITLLNSKSEHINYTENSKRFFLKVFSVIFKCSSFIADIIVADYGISASRYASIASINGEDLAYTLQFKDYHTNEVSFTVNGISFYSKYQNGAIQITSNKNCKYYRNGVYVADITANTPYRTQDTLYYLAIGDSLNYMFI